VSKSIGKSIGSLLKDSFIISPYNKIHFLAHKINIQGITLATLLSHLNAKSPITPSQLTYTSPDKETSNDKMSTFCVMVDEEAFQKYKIDRSIPLADVVDSFDIFTFDAGRSGRLGQASKEEIKSTFGTNNEDDVVTFMLEHGQLHGKPLHVHVGSREPAQLH